MKSDRGLLALMGFASGVLLTNLGWVVPSAVAWGGHAVEAAITFAVLGTAAVMVAILMVGPPE